MLRVVDWLSPTFSQKGIGMSAISQSEAEELGVLWVLEDETQEEIENYYSENGDQIREL